ncbi:hypothetical protein B0H11DRAFT_1907581 [Mycena galericulata]|nr:hypothetical protein B0H11DRAFT_1907581 [Mycena galericulata]
MSTSSHRARHRIDMKKIDNMTPVKPNTWMNNCKGNIGWSRKKKFTAVIKTAHNSPISGKYLEVVRTKYEEKRFGFASHDVVKWSNSVNNCCTAGEDLYITHFGTEDIGWNRRNNGSYIKGSIKRD